MCLSYVKICTLIKWTKCHLCPYSVLGTYTRALDVIVIRFPFVLALIQLLSANSPTPCCAVPTVYRRILQVQRLNLWKQIVASPSRNFSRCFNPNIASMVCRGVSDPNFRDVSLKQMSPANEKQITDYSNWPSPINSTAVVIQSTEFSPVVACEISRNHLLTVSFRRLVG